MHEGDFTLERSADGLRFRAPDRASLPRFHVPPVAPEDPLQAFERDHEDHRIHDETGLTRWDGERVHYGDVVEVLCADGEPDAGRRSGADGRPGHDDEPGAGNPGDFDLPVKTWLAKHGIDP